MRALIAGLVFFSALTAEASLPRSKGTFIHRASGVIGVNIRSQCNDSVLNLRDIRNTIMAFRRNTGGFRSSGDSVTDVLMIQRENLKIQHAYSRCILGVMKAELGGDFRLDTINSEAGVPLKGMLERLQQDHRATAGAGHPSSRAILAVVENLLTKSAFAEAENDFLTLQTYSVDQAIHLQNQVDFYDAGTKPAPPVQEAPLTGNATR